MAKAAGRARLLTSNLALALFATLTFGLLLEGAASLLLSVRSGKHALRMLEESHARYDPDLGWSHRPGLHFEALYGLGTPFTTNAQGFRATEEYVPAVPPGRRRVIVVGDSFTMGFGVGDAETYPAQMQARCPGLQVVNMGQGGYGLDQALLWYRRDGRPLDAQLVVLAVIAHDLYRMADERFVGYAKPVLRARGGKLVVENVPVPAGWGSRTPLRQAQTFLESLAVVRLSRWALGRDRAPAEAFYGALPSGVLEAAALALDEAVAAARAKDQGFALVYLPTLELLPKEPVPEATWLAAQARRLGVPFVDLREEFGALPPWELARLFRPADQHYTVEGNRLVAAALLRHLGESFPGLVDCPAAP
jgi:hypothetical protein